MRVKGALLADCAGILAKAGENSQSMRVIPFTSVGQINGMKPVLKAYIQEAIDVEKAGLKVDFKRNFDLVFPQELLDRFDENPDLKAAFDALAPGRQRWYNLYFFGAKQSKTKQSRIAKSMPRILAGKGLTDR